jgi:hypothetical protein
MESFNNHKNYPLIYANPRELCNGQKSGEHFFEPRRHGNTEKNKEKPPCLCVSVVKGFVRPLSDDYKSARTWAFIRENSRRLAEKYKPRLNAVLPPPTSPIFLFQSVSICVNLWHIAKMGR